MISLSRGLYDGSRVKWITDGITKDGREYMIIEDVIYVKISDESAVYLTNNMNELC